MGGSPPGRLIGGNTERPGILGGIGLGGITLVGGLLSSATSVLFSDMAESELSRSILFLIIKMLL
jgi:hypothetical protein